MKASEVKVIPVSRFQIEAVLATEPIPDYPLFEGLPLTLGRLEDKGSFQNKGRRKKALKIWDAFISEVNEVMERRSHKLIRLLLTRGVSLDLPPMSDWAPDFVALGMDKLDSGTQKLLYLHHIIDEPKAENLLDLLSVIMDKSGLDIPILSGIRQLFREVLDSLRV